MGFGNSDYKATSVAIAIASLTELCKTEKSNIEKEYNLCEKELRAKTEEVEKLKIEI